MFLINPCREDCQDVRRHLGQDRRSEECRRILQTKAFALLEDIRVFSLFMGSAERQSKCATLRRVSPAPATRYMSRNLPDTAAMSTTSVAQAGLVEQAITSGDSSQAGIAALPGSLMLELRWLIREVKREIGSVRQPALIVHPREDDRASLRNLGYLQCSLGGLTQTVVLDDSYHIVTLDRQRQLVLDRTLEFVSQLDRKTTLSIEKEDTLDWLTTAFLSREVRNS